MKVSVFVDGANFFYMQKNDLKWFADPKKILAYIESNYGEIVDAIYYIGTDAPPEARQQPYLDALTYMGYSLETKHIKTIHDPETGEEKQKANLDIEIAIDMFNTINRYDCAVLLSGDGDFERALRLLRDRGKSFVVLSSRGFLAHELRNVAGRHCINLESLKDEIKK